MKILKVEFENINSLAGHWTVDFESREIRESGLLLISGETGAGKTTILDAICLGLYGQTARVEKAGVGGNGDILSNGTASCFSEVTFEDSDGHRYRMRWSKRRRKPTKANPDGSIEIALRNGPFAVDAAGNAVGPELEKSVDELIGLSFEQFRKTVILPQGEFAQFMKGEDKQSEKQRSDILEKLTGTEIYRQISKKVFELTKAEKEKLTALENALSGVNVLSSDERAALEASLVRLESELPKAEAEFSRWEASCRWFEDEEKLASELTAAEEGEAKSRQEVEAFARTAEERGLKVIIAGAGMAAALPGVVAASTTLPVIGVPIKGMLDGLDAMLSIIQMPPGIPVATVGVNGAQNAAILAAEMLALSDEILAQKLRDYKLGLKEKIVKANAELKEVKYNFKTN